MTSGWSLRARLTALSAAVATVVLALTSALLLSRLRTGLVAAVDATALARARDVAALLRDDALPSGRPLPASREVVIQVVGPEGTVLASSDNIARTGRVFTLRPGPRARTVRQVPVGGDRIDYRVVAVAAGNAVVYAGSPVDDVQDGVTVLTTQLAVSGPALLALLAAGTWLLVGRVLRPVELIRRQAEAIPASDLTQRVAVPSAPELARLAATLNDLLGRVEHALSQQRRFIGDASHELRTPVAALLASLEVNERLDDSRAAHELTGQAARLSELVTGLLALARLDAGHGAAPGPIDLARLVGEELDQRPEVVGRLTPAWVMADEALLRRAVTNLLDNALRHATTTVTVDVGPADESAVLVVADDGPGVPPGDRERIFERFTRLDDARARDDGGVGLGLAIAREAVVAAGGHICVEDAVAGARFVVRLPLMPSEG